MVVLARLNSFAHSVGRTGIGHMQRKRAIAIAIEQQQTHKVRLIVASGLLLSAALLLLLISP